MSQAGGATSSSRPPPAATLERWLVSRIMKKGVPSLSQEEISVINASMPAFEEEWKAVTNQDLPPDVRSQLTDRLQKKESQMRFEDLDQIPAFHRAVIQGDITRVKALLQKNVSHVRRLLTATDTGKKTALHMAAKEGYVDIIQLLADHSAEMDAKDRTGRNPLHIACEYGQAKAVQMLLKFGINPELPDGLGRNAFHLACCSESLQSIDYLLARKPKLLQAVDKHQRTGLFYAVLNTHASGAGEIIAQKLLDGTADPNFRDAYRKTALHYACEENRKRCAMLLLKYRADPAVQDGINRMTPLQVCTSDSLKRDIRKFLGIPEDSAINIGATIAADQGAGDSSVRRSSGGKKVEFEPVSDTNQQGYTDANKTAVARAPVALGLSFAQLRDRFIRLMQRVQEGGLQQYEHIKQPHLFTASWMQDVSSHQQLLGVTLSKISGPETAIRIFNLLRPPSHFPASRGDERDILSYYAMGNEPAEVKNVWDGAEDPFKLLSAGAKAANENLEAEYGQARRQDLIKEIFELRQMVETKECANEELKKKNTELQMKVDTYLSPEEVRGYRDELARLRAENTEADLAKQNLEGKISKYESEVRVLKQEMEEQAAAAGRSKTELNVTKARLEAEMQRQGEAQAWKTVKERIEVQLDDLENDKRLLEQKVTELTTRLEQKGSAVKADEAEIKRMERRIRLSEELAEKERMKAIAAEDQATAVEIKRSKLQAECDMLKDRVQYQDGKLREWQAKYKSVMNQRAQEQYSEVAKLVGLEQETKRLQGVLEQEQVEKQQMKNVIEMDEAEIERLRRQPTDFNVFQQSGGQTSTIGGPAGLSPGAESAFTAKTIRNNGQETAMDTMGTDAIRGLNDSGGGVLAGDPLAAAPGAAPASTSRAKDVVEQAPGDAAAPDLITNDAASSSAGRRSSVERQDTIIPPELRKSAVVDRQDTILPPEVQAAAGVGRLVDLIDLNAPDANVTRPSGRDDSTTPPPARPE
ncbi:unnamed protein product [Amoebophrya sp. A120]|nr:unnamed protein product [Amoebophrya sp. A120]|eukprot:GSA120T00011288001.1